MDTLNWNNKQYITVDTAALLGKAFATGSEFRMSLEQNFRLRIRKPTISPPVLDQIKPEWIKG